MLNQAANQETVTTPIPMMEPRPLCPACECGMRFIGPKGHCLIWVCGTCGHALIRRTREWEEDLWEEEPEERQGFHFVEELLG